MQKLTDQVVTQLNDLPGFPARPNTTPPAPDRWVLGDWLVECRVSPEVANAAALPLTDNRVGDVRVSLADQLWFIWDGAAWQSMAGGGGAVAAVTASAPIASSGGVNPNISFPTWPANASGSLTNDGAGNLTWATAGGITGSGSNGYLTLWNGASTVTGVNNGTNEGLQYSIDLAANGWNKIIVSSWSFADPTLGNQVRLESPSSGNIAPENNYCAQTVFRRNNSSLSQGLSFRSSNGTASGSYNWFFGQVTDSGAGRADGGKIVLYAGDNAGLTPSGTKSLVTFRQPSTAGPPDPAEVIFNENLNDQDFRIAGDNVANLFVVDGSADQVRVNGLTVGIGNASAPSTSTAFGVNVLGSSTGDDNVGVGYLSLLSNGAGVGNVAIGREALRDNVNAGSSVAVGRNAASFSESSGVTAIGTQALFANVSGVGLAAVGYQALSQSTGSQNTALGYLAGLSVTSGSNLTLVGWNAQPSAATTTNEITLGDAAVATLRCAVTSITAISDARDKADVQDLTLGLDFLKTVHPVQFKWDRRDWYADGVSDGSKKRAAFEPGFIAQELDAAQTAANAQWLSLVLKENPDRLEATPMRLFPVVVKACQELAAKVQAAEARAEAAEARLAALEAAVAALQAAP